MDIDYSKKYRRLFAVTRWSNQLSVSETQRCFRLYRKGITVFPGDEVERSGSTRNTIDNAVKRRHTYNRLFRGYRPYVN